MKDFPHTKLLIMAVLDTIQFAGLTVSAAGVSPAMTVILLHTSTPFLVLGSRYSFPDRKYSSIQIRGVQLIALAVIISLISSSGYFISPGVHESDITSSFVYFCMAALHGTSWTLFVYNMMASRTNFIFFHGILFNCILYINFFLY